MELPIVSFTSLKLIFIGTDYVVNYLNAIIDCLHIINNCLIIMYIRLSITWIRLTIALQ